jgi:hypothetical protein
LVRKSPNHIRKDQRAFTPNINADYHCVVGDLTMKKVGVPVPVKTPPEISHGEFPAGNR